MTLPGGLLVDVAASMTRPSSEEERRSCRPLMMSLGNTAEPDEQLGRAAEAPRTGRGGGRRRRAALAPGLVAVMLVAVALVGGAVFGGGVRRGGLRRRLAEGGDGGDDSDALSGCSVEEVGCFTVRPAPTLASCPDARPPGSGAVALTTLRLRRTAATAKSAGACSTAWPAAPARAPPRRPR